METKPRARQGSCQLTSLGAASPALPAAPGSVSPRTPGSGRGKGPKHGPEELPGGRQPPGSFAVPLAAPAAPASCSSALCLGLARGCGGLPGNGCRCQEPAPCQEGPCPGVSEPQLGDASPGGFCPRRAPCSAIYPLCRALAGAGSLRMCT